jgi:hypothetical protein
MNEDRILWYIFLIIFTQIACSSGENNKQNTEDISRPSSLSVSLVPEDNKSSGVEGLENVSFVSHTPILTYIKFNNATPNDKDLVFLPKVSGLTSKSKTLFFECANPQMVTDFKTPLEQFVIKAGETEKRFCAVFSSTEVESAATLSLQDISGFKIIPSSPIKLYPASINAVNQVDKNEPIKTGRETSMPCVLINVLSFVKGFPTNSTDGRSVVARRSALARKIIVTNENNAEVKTYENDSCGDFSAGNHANFPGEMTKNRARVYVKRPEIGSLSLKLYLDSLDSGLFDTMTITRVD